MAVNSLPKFITSVYYAGYYIVQIIEISTIPIYIGTYNVHFGNSIIRRKGDGTVHTPNPCCQGPHEALTISPWSGRANNTFYIHLICM